MKIRLLEEHVDREVELIGKVLCTRSDKHDMSWEFQKENEYDLYKQIFEDGTELFIVFNDGWYSNFTDINMMSDDYYDFVLKNEKRIEYEKYMKQITDAFIEMQSNITCSLGHKSENSKGFKTVIWNGGIEYTFELNGGLHIQGITLEEAEKYNADVALKYLNENSLTYDEWLVRYN